MLDRAVAILSDGLRRRFGAIRHRQTSPAGGRSYLVRRRRGIQGRLSGADLIPFALASTAEPRTAAFKRWLEKAGNGKPQGGTNGAVFQLVSGPMTSAQWT